MIRGLLLLSVGGLLIATRAFADGVVLFGNRVAGRVDARVFVARAGSDTKTPVGDGYAQLLAGNSPENLAPVGEAVPFRNNSDATRGYFLGVPRTVPTVDDVPGGRAFVRVVAWAGAARGGETYAIMQKRYACGVAFEWGASEILEMDTSLPDGSEEPSPLLGLTAMLLQGPLDGSDYFFDGSFRPSTNGTLVGYYQGAALLHDVPGELLFETSTNLVDWMLAFRSPHTSGVIPFTLTNVGSASFIRARRLGCED